MVHVSACLPKSLGTRTRNTHGCRLDRKYVGCPRSATPGSIALSGPAGITSSSCQFRLKYPKTRSNVPSPFRIQPSKYGTTSCPLENFVDGSSVGSCCAWATTTIAAPLKGCPTDATPTSASAAATANHLHRAAKSDVAQAFRPARQANLKVCTTFCNALLFIGLGLSVVHPLLILGIVDVVKADP